MREHVEAHRLRERPALADGHDVALLDVLEARADVHGHVLMSLLETAVLAAPVEVVAADDDGARHLGRDDHTLEDAAADRHVAREGALLVDVRALERELRGLEAEADVADIPQALLRLLRERALAAEEDGVLLLVRLLGLIGFPMRLRHLCRLSRAASPCGVRR